MTATQLRQPGIKRLSCGIFCNARASQARAGKGTPTANSQGQSLPQACHKVKSRNSSADGAGGCVQQHAGPPCRPTAAPPLASRQHHAESCAKRQLQQLPSRQQRCCPQRGPHTAMSASGLASSPSPCAAVPGTPFLQHRPLSVVCTQPANTLIAQASACL